MYLLQISYWNCLIMIWDVRLHCPELNIYPKWPYHTHNNVYLLRVANIVQKYAQLLEEGGECRFQNGNACYVFGGHSPENSSFPKILWETGNINLGPMHTFIGPVIPSDFKSWVQEDFFWVPALSLGKSVFPPYWILNIIQVFYGL